MHYSPLLPTLCSYASMSSFCSPIDKTLKDFQSCLYRISTQCLPNWLVF